MGVSRIHVTIDQIVLKGFADGDGKAVVAGLQEELSQFLVDPAVRAAWAKSRRTPVLRLGAMPIESSPSGGREFGGTVARAIGKGLKP